MKKLKNKKSIVFVVLVLFIGLIGGTFAYYTSSHVFENIFHTNPYQTEVAETFVSPDNWVPGMTTPKEVIVTNKANVPVGVRVSFIEEWVDENGDPLPLTDSENKPVAVINFASDLTKWHKIEEDGVAYYYYTDELGPNESTPTLIQSITFNSNYEANVESDCTTTGNVTECSTLIDEHIGGKYTLTVKVQTMQYDQMHPIKAYFKSGTNVNNLMKTLANINDVDYPIRSFLQSDVEPSEEHKQEGNIASTSTSPYPIYMWYDETEEAIYWWSEDPYPEVYRTCANFFKELPDLTDISGATNIDVSKITIFSSAFMGDTSLEDFSPIANWDMSRAITLLSMFHQCSSLTDISFLRNWDVSHVNSLYLTFAGTEEAPNHISSLEPLMNWDVSKVSSLVGTFEMNHDYTSLHGLEKWDISNVTTLQGTFMDNISLLDNLAVEKWNTSKVTNMQGTFHNCSKIENANGIRYWDVSHVTSFLRFFNVANDDPNGIRHGHVHQADISRWNLASAESIEFIFEGQPYMSTELTIRNPNISVYRSAFQDTAFSDGAHITIHYTAETEALVEAIVATKSSQANIVKGNLVN